MEINETEARQLLRMTFGRQPLRVHTPEDLLEMTDFDRHSPSKQEKYRSTVMGFLKRHWESVVGTLPCEGNCAEPGNVCSDAQALICYTVNKDLLDA